MKSPSGEPPVSQRRRMIALAAVLVLACAAAVLVGCLPERTAGTAGLGPDLSTTHAGDMRSNVSTAPVTPGEFLGSQYETMTADQAAGAFGGKLLVGSPPTAAGQVAVPASSETNRAVKAYGRAAVGTGTAAFALAYTPDIAFTVVPAKAGWAPETDPSLKVRPKYFTDGRTSAAEVVTINDTRVLAVVPGTQEVPTKAGTTALWKVPASLVWVGQGNEYRVRSKILRLEQLESFVKPIVP